ncbi:MAG: hypothetical protein ABIU05_25810 [Nitrospirales bacterium]
MPSVVELENDRLYWAYGGENYEQRVFPDLLDGFINLSDAPPEKIKEFAKRRGVLEICKHGYPCSHNSSTWPRNWCEPSSGCSPLEMPQEKIKKLGGDIFLTGWEPVERWHYFARQAKSILNLAASLYQNEKGSSEDWMNLVREYELDNPPPWNSPSLDRRRRYLAYVLNDWLQLGGVRPAVSLTAKTGLRLELGGSNLFSYLGVQLALAVSRTDQMAFCSGCSNPYFASGRRPAVNRRNYCEKCRDGGLPQRDAARDYRSRTKVDKKPRSTKGGGTDGSQRK